MNNTAKERLINLHEKLNNQYQFKVTPLLNVICPYANLGFVAATKEAFNENLNQTDIDRCQDPPPAQGLCGGVKQPGFTGNS